MSDKNNINLDPSYKDQLDIQFLFNKQIDRCLFYSGDPRYDAHVLSLQRMLPQHIFDALEDQADRWTYTTPIFVFKTSLGRRLGSVESPLLFDENIPVRTLPGEVNWDDPNIAGAFDDSDDEEYTLEQFVLFDPDIPVMRHPGDEVDWNDSNILSPHPGEPKITVEYETLFKMIIHSAELMGILWPTDRKDGIVAVQPSTPRKTPQSTPEPKNNHKDTVIDL